MAIRHGARAPLGWTRAQWASPPRGGGGSTSAWRCLEGDEAKRAGSLVLLCSSGRFRLAGLRSGRRSAYLHRARNPGAARERGETSKCRLVLRRQWPSTSLEHSHERAPFSCHRHASSVGYRTNVDETETLRMRPRSSSDGANLVEGGHDHPAAVRPDRRADGPHPVDVDADWLASLERAVGLELASVVTEQPQPNRRLTAVGSRNADLCRQFMGLLELQIHFRHRVAPGSGNNIS